MPNHVHFILSIYKNKHGTSGAPSPTNDIVPSIVSMLKRFTNKRFGFALWQRGYHDHIIRDEADYAARWQYIENNPQKWEYDDYYTQ